MSSRVEVYAALDTERKYQDEGYGNAKYDLASYGDFLSAIQVYVNEALASYKIGDDFNVMEDVRKITALGVQAMEKLGAQPRILPVLDGTGQILGQDVAISKV